MQKTILIVNRFFIALLLALTSVTAYSNPKHYDLAFHWAPIHIQNVDSRSAQDFIAPFDYDDNWKGADNWDNLSPRAQALPAVAYYAVTESTTHYFIYYGFFHPRDWNDLRVHENDMEGMLVFVRKNASDFGQLEGAITAAHAYLFPYRNPSVAYMSANTPPRSIRTMQLATGFISGETHARPWTYQEPKGHGFYHCGEPGEKVAFGLTSPNLLNCRVLTSNKIYYVPSSRPDISSLPPAGGNKIIKYQLVDANAPSGLFHRRFHHTTFSDFTIELPRKFTGDCAFLDICKSNAANPLWGWRDQKQSLPITTWGTDPALLVRTYWNFGSVAAPVSTYIRNDFADGGNMCTVAGVHFFTKQESSSCVKAVCANDSYCCDTDDSDDIIGTWDSICVREVGSICGQSCDNCTHSTLVTGARLGPSCSQCAAEICNFDPYCCSVSWDSQCVQEASVCQFRYEVHQQDNGWIGPCGNNQQCGETGKSRRLEAVRIYDSNNGGNICYSVHLQGLGWRPEVCSGLIAGTQSENRRLEGIKIRLRGSPPGKRVCYRAHVQDVGWQPWVCDGDLAGTEGQGKRMESLIIKIVN